MIEYAKLNQDGTAILSLAWYRIAPANINQYRQVINDVYPPLENNQKVVEGGLVIESDKVRRTWEIVDKELNEEKQSWSPLEFWNRFTELERNTIFTLSKDNEPLRLWITMLGIATLIENTHPLTISAMNDLVTAGLLTEQRKNEILGLV